jgi:integrase
MTSQNSVYRPSTLVQRKGKWYVQVTKPKSLQFGQDRQARRSTGTTDRKQAVLLQHQLTQEIYDSFDVALGQSDPFFEAVRSQLEAEGFKAKDWYVKGYVERIWTNSVGTRLRKKLSSHIDILRHLRMIDTDQLNLLSEEERQAAIDLATPKPLDSEGLFEFARRETTTPEQYERVARSKIRQLYIKGSDITPSPAGRLSDVLEQFLKSRKPKQWKHDRTMMSAWIKGSFADKPLSEVDRHDAYEFLQEYGESHKKASVRGLKAAMSNVFEWAFMQRELGVANNPFKGLRIGEIGEDATVRRTFTEAELFKLFSLNLSKDERDAFAIMVTTGLRVQDDLLNAKELVVVDGVSCINVQDSKTKSGIRIVPIHPLVKNPRFPLNTTREKLRERVREVADDPTLTNHSLRHTFIDLARNAGMDEELRNFITGHAQKSVGSKYGQGHNAKVKLEAIKSIPHPWLEQ